MASLNGWRDRIEPLPSLLAEQCLEIALRDFWVRIDDRDHLKHR